MSENLQVSTPDVSYELPITDGTIRATDLKQVPTADGPLATYDPGFMNTASCRSSITYIDGDAGILEYRGYPVDQLAAGATHLEVAYPDYHLILKSCRAKVACAYSVWASQAYFSTDRRVWSMSATARGNQRLITTADGSYSPGSSWSASHVSRPCAAMAACWAAPTPSPARRRRWLRVRSVSATGSLMPLTARIGVPGTR